MDCDVREAQESQRGGRRCCPRDALESVRIVARTSMEMELWQSAGQDASVAATQLGGTENTPSTTAVEGFAAVCA